MYRPQMELGPEDTCMSFQRVLCTGFEWSWNLKMCPY